MSGMIEVIFETEPENETPMERLWQSAESVDPGHPALRRFPISPKDCRQMGRALIIPLRDRSGVISAIACAEPSGAVMMLPPNPVSGMAAVFGAGVPDLFTYLDLDEACQLHKTTGKTLAWCPNRDGALALTGREKSAPLGSSPILVVPEEERHLLPEPFADERELAAPPRGLDWAQMSHSQIAYCLSDRELGVPETALSARFTVRQSGLWLADPALDASARRVGSPIFAAALCRDEADHWFHRLLFRTLDRDWRYLLVPAAAMRLRPRQVIADLISAGYELDFHPEAEDLLFEHLRNSTVSRKLTVIDRTGWREGSYVAEDRTFGRADTIHRSLAQGPARLPPTPNASHWQTHLTPLIEGNSRLVLAFCTSLAAAAIGLLPEMGSFGIHLVGQSSSGKSTLLRFAASLWGDPASEVRGWDATAAGLEGLAAAHNHKLLILDELAQLDPRQAAEAAYRLGNGRGRTRGDGRGKMLHPSNWQIVFLSSGEITLAQKVAEWSSAPQRHDGEVVRIMDVDADAGKGLGIYDTLNGHESGAALSEAITCACGAFHGGPASDLLSGIVSDPNGAATFLRARREAFLSRFLSADASGVVRRGFGNFGFLAAAGELAVQHGVLPLSADEVQEAIAQCAESWVRSQNSSQADPIANFISELAELLPTLPEWETAIVDAPGYRRGSKAHLTAAAWADLCGETSSVLITRALARLGALGRQQGRCQSVHRHPVNGIPTRYYVVDVEVIGLSNAQACDARTESS